MKILKYLLYILLVLVGIVILLGLFGPKTYDVQRSRVIAASSDQVWPYVSNWEKINTWSPWVRMDSTIKLTYEGDQGSVGSKYSWDSKKMGSGEQTITALDPNKTMEAELKIRMFGESTSKTFISLQDTAGGTKVTWGMNGNNTFMGRVFGVLMNADKMIGESYEKGLNSLDSLIATVPKSNAMEIQINTEEFPGGNYLAIRRAIKISKLGDFFMNNFKAVMDGAKSAKAELAGAPAGLYYTWEPDKDMTDVACAIPVKGDVKAPAGLSLIAVPAGKAAVIEHVGGYGGLGDAHAAMEAYFKKNNMEQTAPVIEEYVVGESMEKDSAKWVTRIVYFIK